ncbi:MAG: Ig-like domain-containing protein [Isosphaeraceae bacterium]
MTRAIVLPFAAMFILITGSGRSQEITLESVPPVVVRTVPEAGSAEVDPGTKEIRVTFSQAMQDGNWSWATASKESFPQTAGQPSYQKDHRTAVLPVKLEPGKTYALWLNSQKFRNFKGTNGQPAVPYLLVFRTRG